ncbi:MAG: hypothetical protein C5B52_17420 [Bacteroidetes bacterium]|nr:MAG: hypothetical protein C5B52_17420 [Bacteroidota bacterium]
MKRRSSYIDPGNKTDLAPDSMKGGRKLFFGENQNPFFNRTNPSVQKKSGEGNSPQEAQVQSEEKPKVKGAGEATPGATQNNPTPKTSAPISAGKFIVEDAVNPGEGQMRKSDFLTRLNLEVCTTVDRGLAGSGHSSDNCPYIRAAFAKHQHSSAEFIEKMIQRYEPEAIAATSAETLIRLMQLRVFSATRAWVKSGVLPEGMQGLLMSGVAAAGAAVNQMTNILAKPGEGTSTSSQAPVTAVNGMGKGKSINSGTRKQMETAFGTDFSDVELHTDVNANEVSGGMQARAFTYGNHISFASGEYQPDTITGDALLAHELAHVVQQRNGKSQGTSLDNQALEEDADSTAIGAIAEMKSSVKNPKGRLDRKVAPRLKSKLQLQRCNGKSADEKHALQVRLHNILFQPDMNESEIYKVISDMGGDASDVLIDMPPFSFNTSDGQIRDLIGTDAGMRVLLKVKAIFEDGDSKSRSRAKDFDKIIQDSKADNPDAKKPEIAKILKRMNDAVDADPRKKMYTSYEMPLQFPIEMLKPGFERMGGVYYDRTLPPIESRSGIAGETGGSSYTDKATGKTQYPRVFIRLGPLSLAESDNFFRSALFHEFQHYQRAIEARKDDASKTVETKWLENEQLDKSKTVKYNAETEATSTQIAADFAILNDKEMQSNLSYLSQTLYMSDKKFRDPAIAKIKAALSGDVKKQKRMLNLIKGLSDKSERDHLKELFNAISDDIKPEPKPTPPRKKKTK